MGGLVRRYERGPHTESYGAEKEIGVCDVSQVFLLCTSHNPMRQSDVVEAKDSGKADRRVALLLFLPPCDSIVVGHRWF